MDVQSDLNLVNLTVMISLLLSFDELDVCLISIVFL